MQAREAAPRVVRRSGGNQLVLCLEVQRLTAPSATALPARCPDPVVHALLTGLAFAHGAGLPWAGGLWPDVVSRMFDFGLSLTDKRVRNALEFAAPFITESIDSAGRSVYRLHHETYAETLRAQAPHGSAERMLKALEEERVRRDERARKEPGRSTDPYLLDHLRRHREGQLRHTDSPTPRDPDLAPPLPDELTQALHDWLRCHIYGLGEVLPHLRELLRTTVLITTMRTPGIEALQDERGHKSVTVRAAAGDSLHVTEF
ncbi:hypothetical protein [Streptomyces sp. NPDC057616]|uniref:hypothetical protein n=1 Tax=Streptomyces sp. NPDC057616 TaxID=3346183 RepID=UPI0036A7AFBB